MMRKKIILTGASGLIGKILAASLRTHYDVLGLDLRGEVPEGVRHADISDFEGLHSVFKELTPADHLIHLAADRSMHAAWASVLKNNIIGTRNVYECARLCGIPQVIFSSSNHATGGYGDKPPGLIGPGDLFFPDSDYGTSKVFGEAIGREYFFLYGIRSICLRIGSVLPDDNPSRSAWTMKAWLSHRDLVQLVQKSLESKGGFGIYYGVSDNDDRFWDIDNAEKELGYKPQDNAGQ